MTSRILSGLDLQGDDARRVHRNDVARLLQCAAHLLQDVQAPVARLRERLLHDLLADAADLDVHLQGGDPFGRPGDLEVHVAEMILVAEDVGEDA